MSRKYKKSLSFFEKRIYNKVMTNRGLKGGINIENTQENYSMDTTFNCNVCRWDNRVKNI